MTSVADRIAALEDELADIRRHGGRNTASERRCLRRIAMLTEDKRQPEAVPRQSRRFA